METNINMLRIFGLVVIKGDSRERLLIIQDLHRNKDTHMKGHKLTFLSKSKKFQKWTDELIKQGFIEPAFLEGADHVLFTNDFFKLTHDHNSKAKLIENALNDSIGKQTNKQTILDLSTYVQLEFRFRKYSGSYKKERIFIPIDLGEDKTDSYSFNKVLVLESYQRGEIELPQLSKGADFFECRLHFEFAPDSRGFHGLDIEEEEFELAKLGANIEELVK